MQITTARAIIKRAKADDIYDGAIPEDDAAAIKAAEDLVEMAEQAWAAHVRGPEVAAILEMSGGKKEGEAEAETGDDDTDQHAPPESDKSDDSDGDSEGDGDSDSTPSPFRDLDDDLAKTEPWEGYGDDTVSNITEGINIFMGEVDDDPSDFQSLLQNVWAFEAAHKNRKRILSHIIEAWKKSGGEIEDEEPEGEDTPDGDESESVEESQAEAGADDDGSESSDAKNDTESEASSESSEAGSDEVSEGKSGKDAPEASEKNQDGGSSDAAESTIVKRIEAELAKERADGVPTRPEEELPDLPWNWSEISSGDLQNFHMQYASWAFYKSYQRTKHERVALHAKQAADELTHAKRLEIDSYDEKGKEKKVGLIEAEISQDKLIKRWRAMQAKHERMSLSARQELDALHKMVESLSRLETMRHNAWERGRK